MEPALQFRLFWRPHPRTAGLGRSVDAAGGQGWAVPTRRASDSLPLKWNSKWLTGVILGRSDGGGSACHQQGRVDDRASSPSCPQLHAQEHPHHWRGWLHVSAPYDEHHCPAAALSCLPLRRFPLTTLLRCLFVLLRATAHPMSCCFWSRSTQSTRS